MKKLLLTTALMLVASPAFAQTLHHDTSSKHDGHTHVTEEKSSSGEVRATGNVVSVDAGKNSIKIKHDPIKSLGWPTMTMTFTADSGVDLSGVKEGDAVDFTLKPKGKDDYTISGIKKQ